MKITIDRQVLEDTYNTFSTLYDKVMNKGDLGHQWLGLRLADECLRSVREIRSVLNQPSTRDPFVHAGWRYRFLTDEGPGLWHETHDEAEVACLPHTAEIEQLFVCQQEKSDD